MIREPWIADAFRLRRVVGDVPGLSAMDSLSQRAIDALSVIESAQAYRSDELRKNTK